MSYRRWIVESNKNRHEEARFCVDGDVQIITRYNIDAALDYARYIRETEERLTKQTGRAFHHYGIIPKWVLDESFRQGWFHDTDKWRKWIEHPESKDWKTYRKRIFALS